jgi:hypothetical protein
MNIDWQTAVSILVVIFAATVVLRRVFAWLRTGGAKGCAACPNQGSTPLVKTLPLIQIQPTTRDH